VQSPANLGITADTILRRIKKIELIADNESFFQVYLFELISVTVADARALATIFRNRAGNFLLVLTADFDRLDFVFVERIPVDGQTSTIGTPQPKVRPRTLSVERRKPERVQLRVLRRFTWTEADPFAQYEKLLAAYSVAYWSEDHFNNRALFSDYFLKERLPNSPVDFPEWTDDPKPAYKRLHDIYSRALSGLTGKTKESLRSELLEPVLNELGFRIEAGAKTGDPGEPDYRLYASDGDEPLALCLAYPWDRFLDGKDDKRDAETPDHNPGQRVVSLLEKAEAPWIVVTNGRLWRLYSPRAQSRASNYYEIELDEALGQIALHPSGPAEGFRYFWLLFRRQSFERISSAADAKPRSLLDRLFDGSQQYAAELGKSLKERVFEQIFRLLAEGFVADIHEREGRTTALSQERLDAIFQGVLTLLYRLLFLLYAEARDLLPVRETLEYSSVSISEIKREIGDAAGSLLDAVPGKLKKHYGSDSHALYGRLSRLFGVVDRGEADLNMPAYNGGLFISKPRAGDGSAEAAAARFLAEHKVPDIFLAQALDFLARDEDPKTHQLVSIDFKSLGVRQLGSIYEGLLEFRLRIAEEKKAIVKEKGREVYFSFKDLDERQRDRAESQERIVRKGEVYLENDKGERKATGSYYTPDHIVNYIVEHAVGPIVREKFETMRQRLREAERWHRDSVKAAKAKGEKPAKYETGPAVDNRWRDLVNELFDLKILDPAMGSGHFLVETVDYITDKALDFLNSFPWNPIIAHLELVRRTILDEMDEQGITIDHRRLTDVNLLKRHVLKRCIYGVDLNPMAVELAKVSLWLHCFTLGAPLSFLDHHMRCGNSLIGVSVEQVEQALGGGPSGQTRLFGSQFTGLLLATDLMRHVGELSDVTTAQVDESKNEYHKASRTLALFKRLLDVYASQWFRGDSPRSSNRAKAITEAREVAFLANGRAASVAKNWSSDLPKMVVGLNKEEREIVEQTLRSSEQKRFFHWELEFPEVFYGPRPGTERSIARLDDAGFDAVIGNPPYGITLESADKTFVRAKFGETSEPVNVAAVFIKCAIHDLPRGRNVAFIVPKSLTYSRGWLSILDTIWPSIDSLIDAGKGFEDVLLEQVVFHCGSTNTEHYQGGVFTQDGKASTTTVAKTLRQRTGTAICGLASSELQLAEKLLQAGTPLGRYVRVNRGGPWQAHARKGGSVPVLTGKSIGRYEIRKQYVQSAPAAIWKESGADELRTPKIVAQNIIAHITQPIPHIQLAAAYDEEGLITLDTVNNIFITNSAIQPELILGLLNSRLASWFAYRLIYNQAIRTMHFDSDYVSRLVLPVLSPQSIATLVQNVRERIRTTTDKANRSLDEQIDQELYSGFHLTDPEIEMIEHNTLGEQS